MQADGESSLHYVIFRMVSTVIINGNVQGVAGVYTGSSRISRTARSYSQSGSVSDDIQISSQGLQFNELLKKLKSGSDVRMDKVTEYENMVSAGTYQVSNGALADSILQYRY